MSDSQNYLSVEEQAKIASQVRYIVFTAPYHETMFIDKGALFAAGAIFASGIVFWRSSFRGFNLARYGRRRLVTAIMPLFCAVNGAVFHNALVKTNLYDRFRRESYMSFGLRSLIAHQPGLMFTFFCVTTFTFMNAHDMGVIATPMRLFKKGFREEALKIYLSKLRPYAKHFAITWIASSAFMFTIGLLEYQQSRKILAKINRKTLGLKED